jgi:NAD(P)-dependent dehydrogenase (short-subunit alcohol dehydrogenase family)
VAAAEKKIIVVTGAGTGIGKATAQAFLAAGWGVVLAGRRPEPLAEAADGAEHALAVPTDVADPASVDALFAATEARFGRCDALFNNAGMSQISTPFGDIPIDTWRQVVDVNLNGMFYCARAAFNLMRRQAPKGGRIINNGSISAHVPRPGSAAYTATKHAVTGLTRSISLDGRAYDIACGQIDIGNAASDMTQRMTSGVPQADGSMKVEPRMDVAHVAETVLHMASLPLETNIQFVTVMATKMPYIGRG